MYQNYLLVGVGLATMDACVMAVMADATETATTVVNVTAGGLSKIMQ